MSTTDRFWKRIFIGKNLFYPEKMHTHDHDSYVPLAYPLIGLLASLARNPDYSIASKIFGGIFLAIAAVITTPITFAFFGSIALLGTLITGPIDLFSPSPAAEASAATFEPSQATIHSTNGQQAWLLTALPQHPTASLPTDYYQTQSTVPSPQHPYYYPPYYYNSNSTLFYPTQLPPGFVPIVEAIFTQTTPGQGL